MSEAAVTTRETNLAAPLLKVSNIEGWYGRKPCAPRHRFRVQGRRW